jgi:hypothetical protein
MSKSGSTQACLVWWFGFADSRDSAAIGTLFKSQPLTGVP